MAMDITGKVVTMLQPQTGNGKNGTWKKQEFIIETDGKYPKKVCISVWGDKIDQFGVKEGQTITASVEVESREYNGRWYTDIKAWKVAKSGQGQQGAPDFNDGPQSIPASAYSKTEMNNATPEDDLPF